MEKGLNKYTIKAVEFEIDGQTMVGLDVPLEMISDMKLVHNELMEATVDKDGKVTITKTGAIFNG